MSESITWIITHSCGCQYDTLLVDGRDEACVMVCPAGWAMRMNRLPYDAPGAHAIRATRELAMKAAADGFKGLDTAPRD